MKQKLMYMMALCGNVALVTRQGFVVCACSLAVGNVGVYDNHGHYYSFVTLECDAFTILK